MSEERRLISGDQYLENLFLFLYRAIRKQLFLMIVAILVVTAIAYFVAPRPLPIYGAQASVQLGRLAGSEIMNSQSVAARVNAQSFKRRVLQSMDFSAPENDRAARLISDSLTARPVLSDIITVDVSAPDKQQARKTLEVVVHLLNEEQDKILQPALADIQAQIAEIDTNIANLSKIQEAAWALTKVSPIGARSEVEAGDSRSVRLFDILSHNQQTLVGARAGRRELASRASTWKTYPATIVDDILVSSTPLSPRPSRIAFLAGAFTFVGFLLYALVSSRRARPN